MNVKDFCIPPTSVSAILSHHTMPIDPFWATLLCPHICTVVPPLCTATALSGGPKCLGSFRPLSALTHSPLFGVCMTVRAKATKSRAYPTCSLIFCPLSMSVHLPIRKPPCPRRTYQHVQSFCPPVCTPLTQVPKRFQNTARSLVAHPSHSPPSTFYNTFRQERGFILFLMALATAVRLHRPSFAAEGGNAVTRSTIRLHFILLDTPLLL